MPLPDLEVLADAPQAVAVAMRATEVVMRAAERERTNPVLAIPFRRFQALATAPLVSPDVRGRLTDRSRLTDIVERPITGAMS